MTAAPVTVASVLAEARARGYLGPGPVEVQVEHALGFAAGPVGVHGDPAARLFDLGSGGGVPGLVLAAAWPDAEVVLLDASDRRTAFLVESVDALGFSDRVRVVRGRAEVAGRDPNLRGRFDVVVARGFGPPAVTAECGAPFLEVGGRLIVSEPPAAGHGRREAVELTPCQPVDGRGEPRWPPAALAQLGLELDRTWDRPYHYRSLVLRRSCPDRYPRRDGVPARRPLF